MRLGPSLWRLLGPLAYQLTIVAATGLIAIGVSGGVAAGLGAAFGVFFVTGDRPGVTYTAERCGHFQRLHPEAPDCAAAAAAHHFDEVAGYRLAAGLLGLLVLGGVLLARRWFPQLVHGRVLPESFMPTVGASLFGLAAAVLLLQSVQMFVFGWPAGSGQLLSGGLVALSVFLGYALRLLSTLAVDGTAGG